MYEGDYNKNINGFIIVFINTIDCAFCKTDCWRNRRNKKDPTVLLLWLRWVSISHLKYGLQFLLPIHYKQADLVVNSLCNSHSKQVNILLQIREITLMK